MTHPHVADIGTIIQKTATDTAGDPIDLSVATRVELIIRDAAGVRTVLTGTLPGGGTDGVAEFTVPDGAWTRPGDALEQLQITTPAGDWSSDVRIRQVGRKL